jgi:VanZ family protein
MKKNIYKIAFFGCLSVIEFLATTTQEIPVIENSWDKANHFIAFFVLYILLSLAYQHFSTLLKVLLLLAFGMQIEIVQSFIDGRFFSMLDVFADSVGITLGYLGYKYGVSRMKILH